MRKVETIFSELLKHIPRYRFEKAVERHQGDRYVKSFSTWQQLITILYSQIKQKDSLRDIEAGLVSQSARWYHLGLTSVKRSTLSDANSKRDYRIFETFFYHLLERCKDLTPKHRFRFKNPLYTIDATTIDPQSVKFGPAQIDEYHQAAHLEDVDNDQDLDLVLHFKISQSGLSESDTEACLSGETFDGIPILGCDQIRIVSSSIDG